MRNKKQRMAALLMSVFIIFGVLPFGGAVSADAVTNDYISGSPTDGKINNIYDYIVKITGNSLKKNGDSYIVNVSSVNDKAAPANILFEQDIDLSVLDSQSFTQSSSSGSKIKAFGNVVIDLGGHTLYTSNLETFFSVTGKADITIKNGTITALKNNASAILLFDTYTQSSAGISYTVNLEDLVINTNDVSSPQKSALMFYDLGCSSKNKATVNFKNVTIKNAASCIETMTSTYDKYYDENVLDINIDSLKTENTTTFTRNKYYVNLAKSIAADSLLYVGTDKINISSSSNWVNTMAQRQNRPISIIKSAIKSCPESVEGKIGRELLIPVVLNKNLIPSSGDRVVFDGSAVPEASWDNIPVTPEGNYTTGKKLQVYNKDIPAGAYDAYESVLINVRGLPYYINFYDGSELIKGYECNYNDNYPQPYDPSKYGDVFTGWAKEDGTPVTLSGLKVTKDENIYATWKGYGFKGTISDGAAFLDEPIVISLYNINNTAGKSVWLQKKNSSGGFDNVEDIKGMMSYTFSSSEAKKDTYRIKIEESISNEFTVEWTVNAALPNADGSYNIKIVNVNQVHEPGYEDGKVYDTDGNVITKAMPGQKVKAVANLTPLNSPDDAYRFCFICWQGWMSELNVEEEAGLASPTITFIMPSKHLELQTTYKHAVRFNMVNSKLYCSDGRQVDAFAYFQPMTMTADKKEAAFSHWEVSSPELAELIKDQINNETVSFNMPQLQGGYVTITAHYVGEPQSTEYNITAVNCTTDKAKAAPGTLVTVIPAYDANKGKYLESITTDSKTTLVTGDENEGFGFIMPEGDITVTANFTDNTETVSYSITEANDCTVSKNANIPAGEKVTVTAREPSQDERFLRFDVVLDNKPGDKIPPIVFTPADASPAEFSMPPCNILSITAVFEKADEWLKYTVTGENCTISPESADGYRAGTEITATMIPKPDHIIEYWEVLDTSGGSVAFTEAEEGSITFTMPSSNVSVTAHYADPATAYKILNFVRCKAFTSDSTEITSETRIAYGTEVTLIADPVEEGFVFKNLLVTTEGGREIPVADPTKVESTFKMPASNVYVTAVIEEKQSGGGSSSGGGSEGGSGSEDQKEQTIYERKIEPKPKPKPEEKAFADKKNPTADDFIIRNENGQREAVTSFTVPKDSENGGEIAPQMFTAIAEAYREVNKNNPEAAPMPLINIDNKNAAERVISRMFVDPIEAGKLTSPIKTKVDTRSDLGANGYSKRTFEKFFDNNVVTVTFSQKGSFGMTIPMAVRVDLSALTGDTIYLYRYLPDTNTCEFIKTTPKTVDAGGFFHFSTSLGDTLIITDRPLKAK